MKDIINRLKKFNCDRDWSKFHTSANLAKSICIESSELLELFQWQEDPKSIDELKRELADVMLYSLMLAEKYDFDVEEILNSKIDENEKKYPVEKVKGSSKKYNEY